MPPTAVLLRTKYKVTDIFLELFLLQRFDIYVFILPN